ncbi:Mariner Mos1 transposase [Eumeta japonica]|uniref:Mariner Mos1 transposase n=1 Tax=Eumeta variegata TaxID=151549 RepID=A0A4C1WMM0_EUMVA|nr:Mariner Mos1 transposase [Eumeta japonica]
MWVTDDEKWFTYDKNVRKRVWSKGTQALQVISKSGLTRNKLMLCMWWDWKGLIHYESLPPGETIDSDLYRYQMMRLRQEVEKKRPELIKRKDVVFHLDNA